MSRIMHLQAISRSIPRSIPNFGCPFNHVTTRTASYPEEQKAERGTQASGAPPLTTVFPMALSLLPAESICISLVSKMPFPGLASLSSSLGINSRPPRGHQFHTQNYHSHHSDAWPNNNKSRLLHHAPTIIMHRKISVVEKTIYSHI